MAGDDPTETLKERHKETSLTIRRSMFWLLAYSAFCVMTIAQPDVPFVLTSGGVELPVIGASVNLTAFLIAGPLGLLVVTGYLHIFLGELQRLQPLPEEHRLPSLANLDTGFAQLFRWLIFYGVPPAVMVAFTWKAGVLPEVTLMYIAAVAVTAGMLVLW